MKIDSPKRRYASPLRAAQADETRERILSALERLLAAPPEREVSFDAIAVEAGVERRTVFRHFETRDALFDAFWLWFNARHALTTTPTDVADLLAAPRRTFAGFDENEGVIRASLHTPSGRAMRARTKAARRAAFAAALAPVLEILPPERAERITALVLLLFSAPAWEMLKDFGDLSGAEAGDAVSWALRHLLAAAERDVDVAESSEDQRG